MPFFIKYEKLQAFNTDGTPVEPAEYKEGEQIGEITKQLGNTFNFVKKPSFVYSI